MIIVPTFWGLEDCSDYGLKLNPLTEALFLKSMITTRAYENTCAVVFVNAGADKSEESKWYAGLSQVGLPFVGGQGSETKDTSAEGMSLVEVNMEIVEEAERNYRVRSDIAREGWHYLYRHTLGDDARMIGEQRRA